MKIRLHILTTKSLMSMKKGETEYTPVEYKASGERQELYLVLEFIAPRTKDAEDKKAQSTQRNKRPEVLPTGKQGLTQKKIKQ